ncbi:MAG: S53 family peptidase [Ktedonobacteraceae bacterium]|nr:S53 family peptidase [Ktedonobacteraceae bacterium]
MSLFFRRFIPLIIILFLLAACTAPAGNGNASQKATAPGVASATAAATPSTGTASDVCPAPLQRARNCLTPHAMRVAYGVQSLIEKGFTGKGQTVIDIVSFGSPTLKQDMEYYNKIMGLPPVDLEVISPLKVPEYDPNHDKGGWAAETTLDVQIIHAIAPDAKIVVLTSPVAETEGTIGLPEFRQLIQYAIDHKLGTIFSQSWGASELTLQDQAGQQELQKWNDLLQKATTQQGMTFFSSSGDHGATDYADLEAKKIASVPTTSFACDSPWVTAVGGTTLISPTRNLRETAWDGSGGGFSRFYQTPDYQKLLPASVQQQLSNRRGVPDVSAVADPRTGLAMYQDGQWGLAGGTSASAPLWAGLMAIANQMAGRPLGFINPALYKIATSSKYTQDFRDITVGNNTNTDGGTTVAGYPAVTGWDPVTGLGAPIADKLIPDLIAMTK